MVPSTKGSMPAPSGGLSRMMTLKRLLNHAISPDIAADPSSSGPCCRRVPQGTTQSPLWLVGRTISSWVAVPVR